jgi:NodT family efflux transporter outer membrane factor (OMF) lipoprotein
MTVRRRSLISLAVLLLAGCAAGPDYRRPALEIPQHYKEAGAWQPARQPPPQGDWWALFGDPQLERLLAAVDVSNQTVLVAQSRYRAARALTAQTRAGYYPRLGGNVSGTRSRSPSSGVTSTAAASLDASWEADLWGRIGRAVEADVAGAQASAADLAAARLAARAALATAYFQLRVLDAQRRLLDDTVLAYTRALEITRNRFAVGVAGKADVVQAQTQLESTRAQAIDVGVRRAALEHAIAVLTGQPPASFTLPPVDTVPALPPVPLGLPATLLQRRPDIAAAERQAAAANAQIGVAQSAWFPSLSLSASGGVQDSTFARLLDAPVRVWSVGPLLAETLFDAGARSAATAQARATYDASVANYRQTVLGALQEVEDNLATLRILAQESRVQDAAVAAARESVALVTNQYKAGTVSYLNVTTVQAAQLANERTALSLLGQRLDATVALIKALGGGWQVAP